MLASKNKEEIFAHLLPFKSLWYEIGLQCGINTEKLDDIQELFVDPEDCLHDLINELLTIPEGGMPATYTISGEGATFTDSAESPIETGN